MALGQYGEVRIRLVWYEVCYKSAPNANRVVCSSEIRPNGTKKKILKQKTKKTGTH